jgi:hypothetical protein
MRLNRTVVPIALIALTFFALGRLTGPAAMEPAASAQGAGDPAKKAATTKTQETPTGMSPEMMAQMEAFMKAGAPGAHHKALDVLAGTFEGSASMRMTPDAQPTILTGTVTRQWVLDGRYLHETVEAMGDMGPYKAIGYVGYNNMDGHIELVWMDSVSTAIVFETAVYDEKARMLTAYGHHRDPASGRLIHTRSVIDLTNPDIEVMNGWSSDENGREYKSFEGKFTRRK